MSAYFGDDFPRNRSVPLGAAWTHYKPTDKYHAIAVRTPHPPQCPTVTFTCGHDGCDFTITKYITGPTASYTIQFPEITEHDKVAHGGNQRYMGTVDNHGFRGVTG